MFRTVGDQVSLWEAVLPAELLRLPDELARVDALLDDPAFFAPFVPFFDPRIGRPSTPMETYLRLMFLKFRYRLGYESLCREVSDSITWRRFCRIPLDGAVPHPTTLMKLTTRCGSAAVDGLNEALLAKAAEAKVLRTNRVRADTTVVPANVAYPTDSGSAGQGGAPDRRDRQADPGRRRRGPHQGAGPVPGGRASGARDRGEAAVPRRSWAATRPRPRCSGSPGSWPTWPRPRHATPNGCWSTPAGAAPGPRPRPPSWPPAASATRPRAAPRPAGPGGQRPDRAAGRDPTDRRRRPGSGSPGSRRTGRPGWSACTTATPGRSPRAGSGKPVEFGYKAQVVDNDDGIVLDHTVELGNPPDAPQLAPAIERVIERAGRHAAGGHRRPRLRRGRRRRRNCTTSGSRTVVIPRKGKPGKARRAEEHRRAFRRTIKWRTGCEGRISTLKRGYGWDRTRIDGTEGARIWTGHGVFAHNLVKISALAA